jgi:hypothetical protein
MCYRKIVSSFAGVAVAVLLAACGGGAGGGAAGPADLVPIPQISSFDPPFFNFCRIEDGERLLVTVRNQGSGDAAASTTTVQFDSGPPVSKPTSALSGSGGFSDLTFDIPAGCFNADCGFTITVDSGNVVSESSETNNSASGTCIG